MANNYINVYIEDFKDMNPKVLKQLRKLNEGFGGRMQGNIQSIEDDTGRISQAYAYYIMGKDKIIKSWAMVYRNRHYYSYRNQLIIDFYTQKKHRGKGYASTIASVIKKDYRNKTLRGATYASTVFKRAGVTRNA
jgi:predicted GNAT family acetyltransferase